MVIRLNEDDSKRLVEALENPPEPNEALKDLMKNRGSLIVLRVEDDSILEDLDEVTGYFWDHVPIDTKHAAKRLREAFELDKEREE